MKTSGRAGKMADAVSGQYANDVPSGLSTQQATRFFEATRRERWLLRVVHANLPADESPNSVGLRR
jgi:hypothetical protein